MCVCVRARSSEQHFPRMNYAAEARVRERSNCCRRRFPGTHTLNISNEPSDMTANAFNFYRSPVNFRRISTQQIMHKSHTGHAHIKSIGHTPSTHMCALEFIFVCWRTAHTRSTATGGIHSPCAQLYEWRSGLTK